MAWVKNKIMNKRAQSILEYVLLTAISIIALVSAGAFLKSLTKQNGQGAGPLESHYYMMRQRIAGVSY